MVFWARRCLERVFEEEFALKYLHIDYTIFLYALKGYCLCGFQQMLLYSKSGVPQGTVGSNPTSSSIKKPKSFIYLGFFIFQMPTHHLTHQRINA
jgi:hypothetical protein